jgi:hypothetical protein
MAKKKKKLGKAGGSEHRKRKRPSTKGKHQRGKARKSQEREWDPDDPRWRPPRRKPKGYKGAWPPPEEQEGEGVK